MRTMLVLVGGLAGSGKTEFGRLLARNLRCALLDKDTLTRPLANAAAKQLCGDPDDRHSSTYLQVVRPLEYEVLMDTALEVLSCGASAVVTAPFLSELADPDFRDDVQEHCQRLDVRLEVIWVSCDPSSTRSRLGSRGASRDRWKLHHWDDYIESIQGVMPPLSPYTQVDNGQHGTGNLPAVVHSLISEWSGDG